MVGAVNERALNRARDQHRPLPPPPPSSFPPLTALFHSGRRLLGSLIHRLRNRATLTQSGRIVKGTSLPRENSSPFASDLRGPRFLPAGRVARRRSRPIELSRCRLGKASKAKAADAAAAACLPSFPRSTRFSPLPNSPHPNPRAHAAELEPRSPKPDQSIEAS
jgi:hypothetical protein